MGICLHKNVVMTVWSISLRLSLRLGLIFGKKNTNSLASRLCYCKNTTACRQTSHVTWFWHELCFCLTLFLGGLSLHLNHLIIYEWNQVWKSLIANLGHFPLEFFSQIWTQDSLWHLLGPFLVNFDTWQFFGNSRAVRVLMQKYRGLRKSIFSRWRSGNSSTRLEGFRWANGWAIWWYHFQGGVWDTWGLWQGFKSEGSTFRWFLTHLQQLRGYSSLTDFIKHQSIGVA